jgi:two-component system, LuxR family, sensor kinase FixL
LRFHNWLTSSRQWAVWLGLVLAAAIAVSDRLSSNASMTYLYLVPIILVSPQVPLWGVPVFTAVCAILAQATAPTTDPMTHTARLIIQPLTFLAAGLFVARMEQNRRRTEAQEAEEQLKAVIDSSITAIVTSNAEGTIVLANRSAQSLFGQDEGKPLEGQNIANYLPFLENSNSGSKLMLRTTMEGRARRADGSWFYAQAWVSSYETRLGFRTAVIAWDASEQRRDSEEQGLQQLLSSSHILTGAVAHEARNLSAAIAVHHRNLSQIPEFQANPDFRALGALVQSLDEFASAELRSVAGNNLARVDVKSLLDDLAFVIAPAATEGLVNVTWEVSSDLPAVWGAQTSLLQVLLNLANNALRAAQNVDHGEVAIAAYSLDESVVLRITNNGPGIASTETLFKPFQPGAASTGLGLYVSRAIVRTFGGELRYVYRDGWNIFLIELMRAAPGKQMAGAVGARTDAAR